MLVGYARTSTPDQSLSVQIEALRDAGCKRVFSEQTSGRGMDRPGLQCALESLRDGDTLLVWKLDRLGRSVKNLIDIVEDLHERGVQFKSLTDSIDTNTAAGRFFFHVMASLAQMEREMSIERIKAGMAYIKRAGLPNGRPRKMTDSKVESARRLLRSGESPRNVANNLGVSIPTLYRCVPASSLYSPLEKREG